MSETHTIRIHQVLKAPPERVYRAFVDAQAQVKWMPPNGFTASIELWEPRVGGQFRMAFTNFSNGQSHSFGGEYLELTENERIRIVEKFDHPGLAGEILVTVELKAVLCGCELRVTQEGVPAVIPEAGCYLGWQESIALLKLLVEAEVAG